MRGWPLLALRSSKGEPVLTLPLKLRSAPSPQAAHFRWPRAWRAPRASPARAWPRAMGLPVQRAQPPEAEDLKAPSAGAARARQPKKKPAARRVEEPVAALFLQEPHPLLRRSFERPLRSMMRTARARTPQPGAHHS